MHLILIIYYIFCVLVNLYMGACAYMFGAEVNFTWYSSEAG